MDATDCYIPFDSNSGRSHLLKLNAASRLDRPEALWLGLLTAMEGIATEREFQVVFPVMSSKSGRVEGVDCPQRRRAERNKIDIALTNAAFNLNLPVKPNGELPEKPTLEPLAEAIGVTTRTLANWRARGRVSTKDIIAPFKLGEISGFNPKYLVSKIP